MAKENKVRVVFEALMNGFNQRIDEGLDQAQNQFESFSSNVSGLVKGVLTGVAIKKGFDTLFVNPTKKAKEFESQMSKVGAISQASSQDLEKLTAIAKAMGASTAFTATEAGQALEYMSMAGWKTNAMIAGLPPILNLAQASGESLASVSDIVTDAMTGFGLGANEAARFADVLATASSSSNTNVALMGETFKYVSPLAGAMKYSIEDVAKATGLLANVGIKGSNAGTALRSMFTQLNKPSKEAAAILDKWNLKLSNADGTMKPLNQTMIELRERFASLTDAQQTSVAATLVGQEAMSGLLAIVNASEADFNKLGDAITNSAGMSNKMALQMVDNVDGALTMVSSKFESFQVKVGDKILPVLKVGLEQLLNKMDELENTGGIDKLSNAVGKLSTVGIDFLIAGLDHLPQILDQVTNGIECVAANFDMLKSLFIGGLAIGGIIKVVGTLNNVGTTLLSVNEVIKIVTGGIGSLKGAWIALQMVFKASLIGIIISAIIGLIAWINHLCKYTDNAKDFWALAWLEIQKVFLSVCLIIISGLQLIAKGLGGLAGEIPVIGKLFKGFEKIVDGWATNINNNLKDVENGIDEFIGKANELNNVEIPQQEGLTIEESEPVELGVPVKTEYSLDGLGKKERTIKDDIDDIADKYEDRVDLYESRAELAEKQKDKKSVKSNKESMMSVLREQVADLLKLEGKVKGKDKNIVETAKNKLLSKIADIAEEIKGGINDLVGSFNTPSGITAMTNYEYLTSTSKVANSKYVNTNNIEVLFNVKDLGNLTPAQINSKLTAVAAQMGGVFSPSKDQLVYLGMNNVSRN